MKENFDKSLKMILHHEGGYVNHPRDPGGETNLGVTKRVYEEWGGTKSMKDLTEDDALVNARLARILTADDYDFKNKQPKLWSPAADYKVDSGTGSKDEAD